MADSNWDDQFKSFMKRAGEDLKRVGEEIRTEAQKLIAQVQDPATQEKVKEKAREVAAWAKQAANDVADVVEKGLTKVQGETSRPAPAAAPPPKPGAAPEAARKPAPKKKPTPAAKKKSAGPAKKTIGPKKKR